MMDFESVYGALFALASAAAGFETASRRLRHWSDVAFAEQPALFMSEKGAEARIKAVGAPAVWTLSADLWIYAYSGDPSVSPATLLNPLMSALTTAFAPVPPGLQRLGLPQIVQHAYIAGKIETDEGVLGDQAVAIMPVEVLCLESALAVTPTPLPPPQQGIAIGGYSIVVDRSGDLVIIAPDGSTMPLVVKT